jgi:hypothetical protein
MLGPSAEGHQILSIDAGGANRLVSGGWEGTMWEVMGYAILAIVILACLSFIGSSLNDEGGHD